MLTCLPKGLGPTGTGSKPREACLLTQALKYRGDACFCFSYFILRKLRGEGRREFILNSTPLEFLESSFVFCISLFENQRSRDETVVVSKSKERGGWGGRSPPHFACCELERGEKRERTLV